MQLGISASECSIFHLNFNVLHSFVYDHLIEIN